MSLHRWHESQVPFVLSPHFYIHTFIYTYSPHQCKPKATNNQIYCSLKWPTEQIVEVLQIGKNKVVSEGIFLITEFPVLGMFFVWIRSQTSFRLNQRNPAASVDCVVYCELWQSTASRLATSKTFIVCKLNYLVLELEVFEFNHEFLLCRAGRLWVVDRNWLVACITIQECMAVCVDNNNNSLWGLVKVCNYGIKMPIDCC